MVEVFLQFFCVQKCINSVEALPGINIRLPANIQTIHHRPQIFNNWSTGSRQHIQHLLIRFRVFRNRLYSNRIIPPRQQRIQRDLTFIRRYCTTIPCSTLHLMIRNQIIVLGAFRIRSPRDVHHTILIVGFSMHAKNRKGLCKQKTSRW